MQLVLILALATYQGLEGLREGRDATVTARSWSHGRTAARGRQHGRSRPKACGRWPRARRRASDESPHGARGARGPAR